MPMIRNPPNALPLVQYFVTLPTSSPNETPVVALWIEESSIEIHKEGQQPSIEPDPSANWVVNVTLGLRATSAVASLIMTISFPELNITSSTLPLPSVPGNQNQPTFVSANFTVPNGVPELWYPHNLGTPKRYNITVQLSPGEVSFTRTTGFRTIVLVQQPVPDTDVNERGITPGDQFHFTINGKAFYTSGTNIIP